VITGNIEGVRKRILEELEAIFDIKTEKYSFLNDEIIQIMTKATEELNREISVLIDRKGKVMEVTIGDSSTVSMPLVDLRDSKLSRVRVVHTHPNGNPNLSALDISALVKMKLDAIVAIGVKETPEVVMGFLTVQNQRIHVEGTKPLSLDEAQRFNIIDRILFNEGLLLEAEDLEEEEERAVLVGLDSEESLYELRELAKAAEVSVGELLYQKRATQDNAYYVGKGKVSEIRDALQLSRSNMVIADDELSGSQIRNLEDELGVKVIDRTTLILEIFAKRARSKEAKLQVELAQLKYRMSRLIGLGTVMSRTGGGIGTRGPGEQKLEIDRRKIRERVNDLKNELKKVVAIRSVQRENRNQNEIPRISLVGYTNSGKSTLRNALADLASKDAVVKEKVLEKDMLFATLDTTTRALSLENNRVVTLTDTVGFVRKLPHDLVEAFKSTLEEVIYSDLLVHVIDGSVDDCLKQAAAVDEVLNEIGAGETRRIIAINKIDKGKSYITEQVEELYEGKYPIIEISAKNGTNLKELMVLFNEVLPDHLLEIEALIPYDQQKLISSVHESGVLLHESYEELGTKIRAKILKKDFVKFEPFIIEGGDHAESNH
jgi:GTP-binding protein HflX